MNTITCSHGVALNVIEDGSTHEKGAIVCTGLTSNIAAGSTTGHLATALAAAGWKSLRFDYCGSLDPDDPAQLRTMDRMHEDIVSVLAVAPRDCSSVLIARGRAAQPALRAAKGSPALRHVILWAPIVWVEAPHSELKNEIMREVDEKGFAEIDGTRVGREFFRALDDPTDADVASWVRPDCRYSIVHPIGDEVHAVHLAERLAGIIRDGGGAVRFFKVPGKHPSLREIPHDQIAAIVAAL